MFFQFLILILGFTLLIFGANILIIGATNIAKKFNIQEVLIGLTIVALGTSLPELVISIVSASSNNTDILLGNVIGSNLCNLLLVLGTISIIKPIRFAKSTLKQNLPLTIIITILVLIMGLGLFSYKKLIFNKTDGVILLTIALIYFIYPILQYIKIQKASPNIEDIKSKDINIFKSIVYILLGGLALKYGGDFVVNSAILIATNINISERVISLTIVALGTSLPELVTSIVAIIKHDNDLAEGNIIGSCILNFCLILGIGATISNIVINIEYIENLILLLVSSIIILLYGLGNKENTLTRSNGIILLIIYFIYSVKLFI